MNELPLSLLSVARRALGLALLAALTTLGLGKLLGWSFPRAYQRLDTLLFMGGALVFCLGVFRGKPALPPRPGPEDAQPLTPSELQALQRARERSPALATAGLALILSTQVLYWARGALGQLYGH